LVAAWRRAGGRAGEGGPLPPVAYGVGGFVPGPTLPRSVRDEEAVEAVLAKLGGHAARIAEALAQLPEITRASEYDWAARQAEGTRWRECFSLTDQDADAARAFGRLPEPSGRNGRSHAYVPDPECPADRRRQRTPRPRHRATRTGPDPPSSAYDRLLDDPDRLRYTLECLEELYPKPARRLIEHVIALEDTLRLYQDAEIAHQRLRRLAAEYGTELPPVAIFMMGEIAERYRRSMAELRTQVPTAYARTRGKSWKALRKRIEAKRPTVPVPAGPAHREEEPEAKPDDSQLKGV